MNDLKLPAPDSELIDFLGVDGYYKHMKKLFVARAKQMNWSQSETHENINKWLKAEGQAKVSLSYVKRNW